MVTVINVQYTKALDNWKYDRHLSYVTYQFISLPIKLSDWHEGFLPPNCQLLFLWIERLNTVIELLYNFQYVVCIPMQWRYSITQESVVTQDVTFELLGRLCILCGVKAEWENRLYLPTWLYLSNLILPPSVCYKESSLPCLYKTHSWQPFPHLWRAGETETS